MASCQSPFNIMRDLDSKMVKFFHSVFLHKVSKRDKHKKYANAFKEVMMAYCNETISAGTSDISFKFPRTRCAYVYRFCACIATATAYHFMQLMKCNAMLFQKMTFSDTFRVCCLGGGPGTEIVAIVKILDGLVGSCCPTRRKPLLVKATIIDKDPGWKETAKKLIRCWSQLVDTSHVRCDLNFIESNLAEPFTREVTDALEEADLITMVTFLSAVYGSKYKHRMEQMLQGVISRLREDCTIFFLDFAFDDLFDVFRKTAEASPGGMSETYGPVAYDLYKMSVYSVADNIRLNARRFGEWLPPFAILTNVSAWSRGAVPNRRGPTVVPPCDDEAMWREARRHIGKCLRFCFPREDNLEREFDFASICMFSTKSKSKRIEGMLEI